MKTISLKIDEKHHDSLKQIKDTTTPSVSVGHLIRVAVSEYLNKNK